MEPCPECNLYLHPGEVKPGASVDSNTKGNMTVIFSVEPYRVGIFEDLWIVVGGWEVQQNLVSRLKYYAGISRLFKSVPTCGYGGIEPQHFLDGAIP